MLWLLSDERIGAPLARLAVELPPGSGIILRHDTLPDAERWRLLRRLKHIAAGRRLVVILAGTPALARRWGADGVHLRQHQAAQARAARRARLLLTMPVHDAAEAAAARRAAARAVFVSPLHPTRSHPGAAALRTAAWLRLARRAGGQAIALGGMTPARARALRLQSTSSQIQPGWAAIDAWAEKAAQRRRLQKRNCVPT
ncbi:thiamine-phosphate pyrophosphorylase [Sphingopyxis flava]|uniref:Thiamine-phosphate pyrophosphorylase n=2 Tax=Sphingopyxis flava TaxID=1507287 RepID=A0A1T5D0H9_9SPHN|nr:thiamine-phosphate pyrophosphorylase [Sphingopyxis flava]